MSTIKGKVIFKGDVQQISDKFKKQDFVIEVAGQYPQKILVQVTQERTDLLNGVNVGGEVEVSYNLKGRSWTNPQGEVKYFNTIEAWKIEILEAATAPAQPTQPDANLPEDDSLPF